MAAMEAAEDVREGPVEGGCLPAAMAREMADMLTARAPKETLPLLPRERVGLPLLTLPPLVMLPLEVVMMGGLLCPGEDVRRPKWPSRPAPPPTGSLLPSRWCCCCCGGWAGGGCSEMLLKTKLLKSVVDDWVRRMVGMSERECLGGVGISVFPERVLGF